MISSGDQSKKTGKTASTFRIVSFYVSQKEYAIAIDFIKEIIYSKSITPLPDTPDYIEGVIDLRGIVVPVVNLKKRLKSGAGAAAPSDHILIVEVHRRKFGLIVDRVLGVIPIAEERIQAPQDFLDRQVSCLRGVCKLDDRLVLLLDLERLWNDLDLNEIQSTLETPP